MKFLFITFAPVLQIFPVSMLREEPIKAKSQLFFAAKMRDYTQLLKPNLSFMVVFSSVIGYLLAPGVYFIWAMCCFYLQVVC